MTQKDKELLLKDLYARLPYGVIIEHKGNLSRLDTIFMCDSISISSTSIDKELFYNLDLDEIKPYLFPLESITEEQKKELEDMGWSFNDSVINNIIECLGNHRQWVTHFDCFALIEWCCKNHLDVNDLIPMGVAVDATGLNIY